MNRIVPIPAFKDNYIWIMIAQDNTAIVVDPGDAAPVTTYLTEHALTLSDILITHHHPDHIGGIETLRQHTGAQVIGPKHPAIQHLDHVCEPNDKFTFANNEIQLQVLPVPAHTLDHIAYVGHVFGKPILFCGDTLFSAGCGRLFEGTAEQLLTALNLFLALPEETLIYSTHEYTQANLRFAQLVEPNKPELETYAALVADLRQEHLPSLPTTLAREKRINPFLRCDQPAIKQAVEQYTGKTLPNTLDVLRELRLWKDHA